MRQKAVIFDLDGVLADSFHRVQAKEFWTNHTREQLLEWSALCFKDTVIPGPAALFRSVPRAWARLIVTARSEPCRRDTAAWLAHHDLSPDILFMRPYAGSSCANAPASRDPAIKEGIYLRHIEPNFDVQYVVEDRTIVVEMWRNLGLCCFQNVKGDY